MTFTVTNTCFTKAHGLCYGITICVIRSTVTVTVTDRIFFVTRRLVLSFIFEHIYDRPLKVRKFQKLSVERENPNAVENSWKSLNDCEKMKYSFLKPKNLKTIKLWTPKFIKNSLFCPQISNILDSKETPCSTFLGYKLFTNKSN